MRKRLSGRLSQNTLTLLIGNTGSAILSFLLSILIGRVLGETGLGVYAASLAWIFPISLIAEFGIGTLVTRNVSQDIEDSHAYLRSSLVARLLLGGLLVCITFAIAPFLSNSSDVIMGIRLSAVLILILPIYSSFTAIFRSHEQMQPIAILNLGMLIAQVSLTGWVFYIGYGVHAALIVNVLTSLGQSIAAMLIYWHYFYKPTKSVITLSKLLRGAYPFAIAAILAAVQSRLNILILERSTNEAQVGYYAAAFRFIEAGRLIPHAFFDALFPHLSALAATPALLNARFRQISLGLLAFGGIFIGGALLTSAWVITLTYGDSFTPSIPILNLASVGLLFLLLKGGRTLHWYAQGHENFVNRTTFVVIILQTLMALALIPRYGAVGAAGVFVLSEALAFLLLLRR